MNNFPREYSVCFQESLLEILSAINYDTGKNAFISYLEDISVNKSSRNNNKKGDVKRIKKKSCATYLSNARKVLLAHPIENLTIMDILDKNSIDMWVLRMHAYYDGEKKTINKSLLTATRQTNAKPALTKLFEWLKYESKRDLCGCDVCEKVAMYFTSPSLQVSTTCCNKCLCGHHVEGEVDEDLRQHTCFCHTLIDGESVCYGTFTCCVADCKRKLPACYFSKCLNKRFDTTIAYDRYKTSQWWICNMCFIKRSKRLTWTRSITNPIFQRGVRYNHFRYGEYKHIKRKSLNTEITDKHEGVYEYDGELMTYKQTAEVMRGGIFTLDKIIEKINDSNTELKKGILLYIDEVIHKINSGVTLNESEVEFVKVAFCVHRKKDIKNVTLSPDGKLIKKKKRKNKKYTNTLYSAVEQETHTEANLAHVQ